MGNLRIKCMLITPESPFTFRFYQYQKERFPVIGHGLLIAIFTFSAIAYSRLCRGLVDFVPLERYLVCVFNAFTLFFLLRVSDEHKDREDDLQYRSYLPVPRGLITLHELRTLAYVIIVLQVAINAWFFPRILSLYGIVMLFLGLMTQEFFVRNWLKQHLVWYMVSHMLIIPLVDVFASGFDWLLEGATAPVGLLFFFITSYCNGVVLEIGRKIKPPEAEEPGVQSYTHVLGTRRAVYIWQFMLLITGICAALAAGYAGHGIWEFLVLTFLFILCLIPSLLFLQKHSRTYAKWIEYASALWTMGMYLTLGGIPMLFNLLAR